MQAQYRFLDRWLVRAPIERVYETVGDPLGYQRWWTDFVLRSEGDAGEPRPGKRNRLLVKAFLPYKVRFGLEVMEAERPTRILSRLSGDFDGTGEWQLTETAEGVEAVLDWRPEVNKRLITYLTPVLRPLFRANHTWAMTRGERQINTYLSSN
ncbi:MAG TPA: SRPBCC family protein [Gaiellaceae bacterium]|nr:SRPBCC family protein [Gaiellaceae bacterium]